MTLAALAGEKPIAFCARTLTEYRERAFNRVIVKDKAAPVETQALPFSEY